MIEVLYTPHELLVILLAFAMYFHRRRYKDDRDQDMGVSFPPGYLEDSWNIATYGCQHGESGKIVVEIGL